MSFACLRQGNQSLGMEFRIWRSTAINQPMNVLAKYFGQVMSTPQDMHMTI